jgi:hypothetical protein
MKKEWGGLECCKNFFEPLNQAFGKNISDKIISILIEIQGTIFLFYCKINTKI